MSIIYLPKFDSLSKKLTFTDINVNDNNDIGTTIPNMWEKTEPNGDRYENCASIKPEFNSNFIDISCKWKECGACEIDKTQVFVIRGICEDSQFDNHYGWTGEFSEGEKYTFRGFSNSFLYWDNEKNYWKLEHNTIPSVYAICNKTIGPYPIGKINLKNRFIFC